ncbi:MAG: hypothetical protein B6A08_12060 [Sorangiineae bacterium NIC37A_2]|nr:MAG: hypothetical protein B6A08_12060 [Sorangiineae bacterium NIC37A_2]
MPSPRLPSLPRHTLLTLCLGLGCALTQASCGQAEGNEGGGDSSGSGGAGDPEASGGAGTASGGGGDPGGSGGGSQGPASGDASSVPPPGDDRTLDELTQEEAAALCLSDVTEEMLYQRCDARAMLTAREGAEVDYAAECERLRGACIASRDNGTIDLECQAFGLLTTVRCAATVGEYKSCVAAVPVPETVPGCSMAYSEAQAYTVSPPPDITGIPACDALRACYQM